MFAVKNKLWYRLLRCIFSKPRWNGRNVLNILNDYLDTKEPTVIETGLTLRLCEMLLSNPHLATDPMAEPEPFVGNTSPMQQHI